MQITFNLGLTYLLPLSSSENQKEASRAEIKVNLGKNERGAAKISVIQRRRSETSREKKGEKITSCCRLHAGFMQDSQCVRRTSSGVQWARAFPRSSSRGTIISRRSLLPLDAGLRSAQCEFPISQSLAAAFCHIRKKTPSRFGPTAGRLSACRAIRAARSVVEDGFQLIGARAIEKRVYEAVTM